MYMSHKKVGGIPPMDRNRIPEIQSWNLAIFCSYDITDHTETVPCTLTQRNYLPWQEPDTFQVQQCDALHRHVLHNQREWNWRGEETPLSGLATSDTAGSILALESCPHRVRCRSEPGQRGSKPNGKHRKLEKGFLNKTTEIYWSSTRFFLRQIYDGGNKHGQSL